MENFIFQNRTKILFGTGQLESLSTEMKSLGRRALVVIGQSSARKSGLYDSALKILKSADIETVTFEGVDPNPRIESARAALELARGAKVESILAIGGGSVIDLAKAVALGARSKGDPWDFFTRAARPKKALPIGVVLTLAATGSEANGNSVISNPATKEKLGLYHPALFPRFAILDPNFTLTVDRLNSAYGIVDILSHIMEQYFHRLSSTPIQDGFAETLMRVVIDSGRAVMSDPTDFDARSNLMWASTLALNGILMAGARGDFSSHQIEHQLSGWHDIAHGAGLAVVFPAWMRMVYPLNIARFTRFARKVWGIKTGALSDDELALKGIDALDRFFIDDLKVGVMLSDYGIEEADIEPMAVAAARQSPPFALAELTVEFTRELLRRRI